MNKLNEPTADDDSQVDDVSQWQWTLVLVHHDRVRVTPKCVHLRKGEPVFLQRSEGPLEDILANDERVSRKHARVELLSSGVLRVQDEGSRNGVFVNGERVSLSDLRLHDVLRVGGASLVVTRTRVSRDDVIARGALLGPGDAGTAFVTSLCQAVATHSVVWVVGEPGFAVEAIARVLDPKLDPAEMLDGMLATLSVPSFPSRQRVAFLRRAERSSPGVVQRWLSVPWQGGTRVMFWTTQPGERVPLDPGWDPLFRASDAVRVDVPPLRSRPEDILALMAELAELREVELPLLSASMVLRLLRAPWPGNEAQLERVTEALVESGGEVDLESVLSQAWDVWWSAAEQRPSTPPSAGVQVALNGRWFANEDGTRVSLAHRPVLVRTLACLARALHQSPDHSLDLDAIIQHAWPGTRFVEDSANARVYVAISTLRRMGLRGVLVRDEKGYRLDSSQAVRVVTDS